MRHSQSCCLHAKVTSRLAALLGVQTTHGSRWECRCEAYHSGGMPIGGHDAIHYLLTVRMLRPVSYAALLPQVIRMCLWPTGRPLI